MKQTKPAKGRSGTCKERAAPVDGGSIDGAALQAGLVDVFAEPFHDWSWRDSTVAEITRQVKREGLSVVEALRTKDVLREEVRSHVQAAEYMLRKVVDAPIEFHVASQLEASETYQSILAAMPSTIPVALLEYQQSYPPDEFSSADQAIRAHGVTLARGQVLFHGGVLQPAAEGLTTRPLSTSLCPQMALNNAIWKGKAYDVGRVELAVLEVEDPLTPAFAYSNEGNHRHEREVVFSSGAKVERVRETLIGHVKVYKGASDIDQVNKLVPAYVVEMKIS